MDEGKNGFPTSNSAVGLKGLAKVIFWTLIWSGLLFCHNWSGRSPQASYKHKRSLDHAPPEISFVLETDRFLNDAPPSQAAFDLVATDMDLDGDPDLFINWHHRARSELYRNEKGIFYLQNPVGNDRSGLFDNPGIPDLYAEFKRMIRAARAAEGEGLYVWHDVNRKGFWNIYAKTGKPKSFRIETNQPIVAIRPKERVVRRISKYSVQIRVPNDNVVKFKVNRVATQLKIIGKETLFVGPAMVEIAASEVSLWKADPHGVAWVDVIGSREPDLFLTRGGIMGKLLPPHDPKKNRFYSYRGQGMLFQLESSIIPADYGRGRKVEWVDIDNDGESELYIGNTHTKNGLLVKDGSGSYSDLAPALGLDFVEGDVFTWFDTNRDGFDDLVFVGRDGFRVAINQGKRSFKVIEGEAIGLKFPTGDGPLPNELFSSLSLHVLDFNSDGVLDLWLNGHGKNLKNSLYRAEREGYQDVTDEMGLQGTSASRLICPFDVDNDGYIDAVSFGDKSQLFYNRQGGAFDVQPFYPQWQLKRQDAACITDIDSDGWSDLVIMGLRRLIARNTSGKRNRSLVVAVEAKKRPPIGTVVRAYYDNGRVQAQRYGSAHLTRYSQGLQPLVFGIPADAKIMRVEVLWPGGKKEVTPVTGAVRKITVSN